MKGYKSQYKEYEEKSSCREVNPKIKRKAGKSKNQVRFFWDLD